MGNATNETVNKKLIEVSQMIVNNINVKVLESSEGNVWKYIFYFNDAIAEAVLYRYNSFEERTVICCSVQSGCPVGCSFCGTGKRFIRNLTFEEIVGQVNYILRDKNIHNIKSCAKFQIMFMSMGEPMLNIGEVYEAVHIFSVQYPNAQLLISTMAVKNVNAKNKLIHLGKFYPQTGLQFSVHRGFDADRNELIPYRNKMSLVEIRDFGVQWFLVTKRKAFINYCVTSANIHPNELDRLKDLFSPYIFNFTFSVVCSKDETMKSAGFRDLSVIQGVADYFINDGYNVRIFDPAGQDDIGGGCGMLWHVQKYFREYPNA